MVILIHIFKTKHYLTINNRLFILALVAYNVKIYLYIKSKEETLLVAQIFIYDKMVKLFRMFIIYLSFVDGFNI